MSRPRKTGGASLVKLTARRKIDLSCMDQAAPCARCRTRGGSARSPGEAPRRIDASRFGIDGLICWRCYNALVKTAPRAAARPEPAPHPLVKPTKAAGELATACRRFEALRNERDSDDRREAYATLERLVHRHGAVECDAITYTWDWRLEGFVRRAPRKPPAPIDDSGDVFERGSVLNISEEAWAWR